jgi:CHASE1-domain containing sensor protein/two-component sensor histidine kinase
MKTNLLFAFTQKIRANLLHLLAWFFLLVGLVLTGFASLNLQKQIHQDEQRNFDLKCEEIKTKIENRLAKHKLMLLGGVAMFEASEHVSREEWRIYVKTLGLSRELDGVQGLGFSLWLPPEKLHEHEMQMQTEGFVNYRVQPEGEREVYTSIMYLEPFEGRNLRAFGYDMYSDPVRHAAMDLAMQTGNVALSGKVTLLQETANDIQAGTLMYAPVYQKNLPHETAKQRRAAIFGWVYSPFRMSDLLNNIVLNANTNKHNNLELYVYDTAQMLDKNLLYQSSANFLAEMPRFQKTMYLDFFSTVWRLEFNEFDSEQNHFLTYANVWITLIAGSFISFLLFSLLRAYFFTLQNAHAIAEKLTLTMQSNEKKLAMANSDLLQFTTISTHHLQEPSRRLVSFVRRLQDTLCVKAIIDTEITTILQFIEQSALRQRALIRDIQLYLSASTPRAAMELIDVHELIHKVLKQHAPLIKQHQIQIEIGALPNVKMDRPRLFDIFNCLLENSFCYQCPERAPIIRIYGERERDIVRYYLIDNGIGIPKEYRERVFKVFERLQVQNDQDSTGIGLAIVRRIIESMNGNIYLDDAAGGGLTVIFEFPVT